MAREAREGGGRAPHVLETAWSAFKGALIHPIPLPILSGLLFAQTGWTLPAVVDKPLQLLGSAFGPIALVLVGVTLARTPLGGHLKPALWITASKNLVLPLLVGLSAWAWGITGLPLTVMVVAAALPMGANVFLFAQRYEVVRRTHHRRDGPVHRAGAVHAQCRDAPDDIRELIRSERGNWPRTPQNRLRRAAGVAP